ncbi:hypothetical protein E2C01_100205 [Portunus trituberculatus]|uniref:Uncharacterized protein n=1 Tax=Portunus trituberculatus TaxID=210409 RepID=A0A5B7K2E7_PORTR|nr:hypothetical protein [Portunus trituberculatus]
MTWYRQPSSISREFCRRRDCRVQLSLVNISLSSCSTCRLMSVRRVIVTSPQLPPNKHRCAASPLHSTHSK